MAKERIENFVRANQKRLMTITLVLLTIFLTVGMIVYATNSRDGYVVEVKDDGADNIAQNGYSSITKKIIEDTADSLTYEVKISNLQEAYKNPEVAILIDTSRSMGVNDATSETKTKAIQFVSELLTEVPGVKISISNNAGVKRAMSATTLANYTTTINALVAGEGTTLGNGMDYAISSFSTANTGKILVIFSDATDSILDKLETATSSDIAVFSILTNITNSEYLNGGTAVGKVQMISDVENFSSIYNSINKSLVNLKVTDIFTSEVNEYFDFEVISKEDDVEIQEQENGYTLNIPAIKAGGRRTLTFKLTLKDNVTIDTANTYKELITSDSMKVEYSNPEEEIETYEMKVSPTFVICKKYSLTIQAVSERSDDLPVTDLEMKVVGTIVEGQDESGNDITKTVYDEVLTTDSNGKIKIEDLKTLGDITFEIKPMVNQIGYTETSATQIIVHNDPTGVGTIWAESDTTEPQVDVVSRNITVKLPINVQVFDLKVETVDSNNSNVKLGDIEYRLIQPKLNSKYDMQALYGTTDTDGNLVFKPTVMTKDGTYEYILSQMNAQEGYDPIGNVSLYVTYENGKVIKFVHKYNDSVSSELISETEAKVTVGNLAQKDDTFRLLINATDKANESKKLEGAIYDVELTRVSSGGEQITTSYKGNITNAEGQIELELPGQGNIRIRITEVKPKPGYVEDTETKEIVFVRSEGTVQYISAKNPIDVDAIADSDANAVVVNFQKELKTEQNRIQVHLVDNIERDINIPNALIGVTRIGTSVTYKELTDGNGIANFIVADEEPGTYVYQIELLSGIPYGYTATSLVLGTISVSFDDNKYIYEVGDLEATVPYFETRYGLADEGEFTYHTAYINVGLEPDALNTYNFQIKLVDTDNTSKPVVGARYDITIESEDYVRNITGRITDENGMVTTRLVGKDTITITVKQTETIKGYTINSQTQIIQLTKIADAYQITHQEPNEYDAATGANIGAVISGKNVIYHDTNKAKSGENTILNLYVNKKDTNNNLVSGVRTVLTSSTLKDANGSPLKINYIETDENGYFEILGIKVNGGELNNGERLDYIDMYEVDINGNKVRNTEIKLKLTFRYNDNKEIVEITNVEATWGNRLIAKREFSGYESSIAYESNVYLDIYTGYDDVGNFELDLRKFDKYGQLLPGAKYDVVVTRLDGSKLLRRGLEINDSVEFPGIIVAEGTVIEVTEVEAPIGFSVNEYTQILKIDKIDDLTGEIEVSLNGNRANISSKNSYLLEDGSLKTSVVLDLVDYELDTFKFGIKAKDSTTLNPVEGYSFIVTSDQGAQVKMPTTDKEGKTSSLVGEKYKVEDYVVTYEVKCLDTADFYKELEKPIQIKVVFNMNGEVKTKETIAANEVLEGYGTIWSIEATNTFEGNGIDIQINVDPEEPLIVNIVTKDTFTGAVLTGAQYEIEPSINITATGENRIEVGYVLPSGIQTYTLKQTKTLNRYSKLEDQQFRILYDEEGNISKLEALTEGITISSFNGKEMTLEVEIESNVPIVISNIGYFNNEKLLGGEFEVLLSKDNARTVETDANGNAIVYLGRFGTNETVKYTIRQTNAREGYAKAEEFQIEVDFDQDRGISAVRLVEGNVNKNVEFVTVSFKRPSEATDIGYNGNDRGIINIQIKNYPDVQISIENVDRQDETKKLAGTLYEVSSTINTKDEGALTGDNGVAIANMDKSGYGQTVRYTISEITPSSGYQTLAIEAIIEVDFDDKGYVTGTRVVQRDDVTTTSLPTIVNEEDNFKINVQIKSNPEFVININKVDSDDASIPVAGANFAITARTLKSNLSNYTEEEIGKLTLNAQEITEEDYLALVLDRLKINEDEIEIIKQNVGIENVIADLKEANKLTNEEEDQIRNGINNSDKINIIVDLGKATKTEVNTYIKEVTNAKVIEVLIGENRFTQDRVNELTSIVKNLVRLDEDYVKTSQSGQAIAYMDKTLANKTIEYTIKETKKAPGYDWPDEIVILEVTYDETGKMVENEPVKVVSGDIEVTNVDINNFAINVTITNTPSKEVRIHLTVEDVYDANKKLETAEFDTHLVETVEGVGFVADDKYRVQLASGTETSATGRESAHGEDTEVLGVYEGGAGSRILRLVQKATPNTYYLGTEKHEALYQSISYTLLVRVDFDDEGTVTGASLYSPGGYIEHVGLIADGRYLQVSHTKNTINITVRYYPMLQVQMQTVDMYTGENLGGKYTIIAGQANEAMNQDKAVSSGFITPPRFEGAGKDWGRTYSADYTVNSGITEINETTMVGVAPTEADTFPENKSPDTKERVLYIYERTEPSSPIQYQKYRARHVADQSTSSIYLIGQIKVFYNDLGEVIDVKVTEYNSHNNITKDYIEVAIGHNNVFGIQITIKYVPTTRIIATVVDQITGVGLSGIRIEPFLNTSSPTASQSYQYREISYYTTGNNGSTNWRYWGANEAGSANRYILDTYTTGSGYDGYIDPGNIILDVSYDEIGRITSVTPKSADSYGDVNAIDITWNNNDIRVKIPYARKFNTKINKIDYYDSNTILNATFKVISSEGASANVTANKSTTIGKIYPGKTVKYTLSETTSPIGYVPVENLEYYVTFNNDGTVRNTEYTKPNSDSDYFKFIKAASADRDINTVNKTDMEIAIKNKPRFDIEIQLSDKFYPELKLKGALFSIENSKGDTSMGAVSTDANGILETYVGPIYPDEEVIYTIRQTNTVNGYYPNDEVLQMKVKFNTNGKIEEYSVLQQTENSTIDPNKFVNRRGITVQMTNLPKDIKIGVYKYDELTNEVMGNVKFNVKAEIVNERTSNTTIVTNDDGTVIGIADNFEKRTDYRIVNYTISEIEVPNSYRKIQDVVIQVMYNPDGSMYLYDVLSNESGVQVEIALNKKIKYMNGMPIHMKLTIPNDNAYDLIIKNEDRNYEGLGIEGTIYDVTINGVTTQFSPTNAKGITKLLNQTHVGDLTIRISERQVGEGYRADNNNDVTIEVYKGEEEYSLSLNSNSNETYADVVVDEDHGTITVTFKNETKLELNLFKDDINTGKALEGAVFEITEQELNEYGNPVEGTQKTITTETNNTTNSQGLLYFDLGVSKQNKVIEYTLRETKAPAGYVEILDIKVKVTFDMYGRITKIEDDSFRAQGWLDSDTGESRNIILNVSNGALDPQYTVKVISADSQTGNRINGSVFQVEAFDENGATYKSATGTTRSSSKVINGKTYVAEKGVMKVGGIKAENNVRISLNQVETAVGYVYGNNKINGNVIINAEFTITAENLEKDLELSLVDDGGFNVTIDNTNREIIIKVENDPQLTLNITKIEADTGKPIKGAEFNVTSVMQTTTTVQPTDLNETSKLTDEKGYTEINGGLTYAGKTVIYTVSEQKLEDYNELEDVIILVRFDTKGNIVYYEILSDLDDANIEDGQIQVRKRILGDSDTPGIVEVDYRDISIPTGIGTRILELEIKNTKEGPKEEDYQIIIEKHHELDPDYPYFIPGVTFEIRVTQEYGKVRTEWTDITNADGLIISPYFSGYGNITIDITEIAGPDGYKLDFATKTIRLTRNKDTHKLNIISSDVGYEFSEDNTKIYLKPVNEIKEGVYSIVVSKTDKNNNVLIANNPANIEIYKIETYESIKEVINEETGETTYEKETGEINERILAQNTDANGRIVVDGLVMPENIGTYRYIVKEARTPEGYVGLEGEAEIDVTFDKNESDDMVITKAVLVSGENVKIAKTADQLISIVVENEKTEDILQEGEYSLDITKTDKEGNAITEDTAIFKLTDNQTGEISYFETDEYGKLNTPKFNIPTEEGTYTYVLNEIKAPEGYMLNREDITVTLEFKQNEEGKIYLNNVTVDGQNIVYEKSPEGELPNTKISIDVINEEGQSGTGNTNSKTYTIVLNKVDSKTKENITERVEFEATLANGEIVYAATNEQGQIVIENVFMPANPGEYEFVVKELTTPKHYEEDREMKIVKVTFTGYGDNMVISNIELDGTYNKNIEIVTEECAEDKVTLNVLNVRGNPELYVVSRQDENQKDIYEVQGRGFEGRHYTINEAYIDTKVAKYGSNMTVQEFIDNLESNGVMTVLDKDGNELSSTDRVKTGMTLRSTLDTQELRFTIIVKGDYDGDGRVRTLDLDGLIKHMSNEKIVTDPIALRALDLIDNTEGGRIRTTDLNEFYKVLAN